MKQLIASNPIYRRVPHSRDSRKTLLAYRTFVQAANLLPRNEPVDNFHRIMGVGFPSAWQSNLVVFPATEDLFASGSIFQRGATETKTPFFSGSRHESLKALNYVQICVVENVKFY